MACTLIQYRKIHRAFLLVLIEDRGPHVDLFLKHQVLICLARCLGLFQGLASTTVSTHCHCHILLLASKLRISAKKNIEKVWYQYGSHQYLCNKPRTLQGNFWCVMASLRLSGLDAAKSMGLDVAKSMGLDAAKS